MSLDDSYERRFGPITIAGVDEVGRGPWAGPVLAAAVILRPDAIPEGLDDSKKLSAKRREALSEILLETATCAIGEASVAEIDRINILQASLLAMQRAISALPVVPDLALVDGKHAPKNLPCRCETLVGGDHIAASIAAASVVAKVSRDRMMKALANEFPQYGWETNAGYGTKAHRLGLFCHGVTPHHRRSFKPIHNILLRDGSTTN